MGDPYCGSDEIRYRDCIAGGLIGDVTEPAERFHLLKKKQSDWKGAG